MSRARLAHESSGQGTTRLLKLPMRVAAHKIATLSCESGDFKPWPVQLTFSVQQSLLVPWEEKQ